MLAEFFLDNGKPATLILRIIRASLVMAICTAVVAIGFFELGGARRLSNWPLTRCQILDSNVESLASGFDRRSPYHLHVDYSYQINNNRIYKSEEPQPIGFDSAGLQAVCYVNPIQASESVLTRTSVRNIQLFIGGAILIELILLVAYCIPQVFFYIFTRQQSRTKTTEFVSAIALFLGFGSIFFYWTILPISKQLLSHRWIPLQTTIVESNVIRSEQHGEVYVVTYQTDIHYTYQFGGVSYHSNCYNFTEGQTLLGSFRAKFVRSFPAGKKIICYVNPNDPQTAVLTQHISPGIFNSAWVAVLTMLGAFGIVVGGNAPRMKLTTRQIAPALILICATLLLGFIWGQLASP